MMLKTTKIKWKWFLKLSLDKIGEINNEPVDCGITEKHETINELKIELCNCEDNFESSRNDFLDKFDTVENINFLNDCCVTLQGVESGEKNSATKISPTTDVIPSYPSKFCLTGMREIKEPQF